MFSFGYRGDQDRSRPLRIQQRWGMPVAFGHPSGVSVSIADWRFFHITLLVMSHCRLKQTLKQNSTTMHRLNTTVMNRC
jgi:hypothetical protein